MQQVLNSLELSPTVSHRSSWRSLPSGTWSKKGSHLDVCMMMTLLTCCMPVPAAGNTSNCDLHLRSAFVDAVSVLENT